ncbi:hypothetical protein TanjilG_27264 [Lupinus angustifolius]|uniref:Uncharacterized protein n=1 Tax=Lupinus angustifolius TaxID=3871 RepID=A0A1J7FVL1_LUPAN|nr:hypothetical protein TanjilG_27264 [Lupinus angustifolius]
MTESGERGLSTCNTATMPYCLLFGSISSDGEFLSSVAVLSSVGEYGISHPFYLLPFSNNNDDLESFNG